MRLVQFFDEREIGERPRYSLRDELAAEITILRDGAREFATTVYAGGTPSLLSLCVLMIAFGCLWVTSP